MPGYRIEAAVLPNTNILKIDVEGAEYLVLRGAQRLLAAKTPLVIFEYITGRDHRMDEIRQILGDSYDVFRLRSDGKLDRTFTKTWNCVAVSSHSVFHHICSDLVT